MQKKKLIFQYYRDSYIYHDLLVNDSVIYEQEMHLSLFMLYLLRFLYGWQLHSCDDNDDSFSSF